MVRKRDLYLLFLFTFMSIGLRGLSPLFSQEMDYEQFFEYRKEAYHDMTDDGWHPREIPWWYDTLSQKVQGWNTVLTEYYTVRTNMGLNQTYYIASLAERIVNAYTNIFENEFGLPPVAEYSSPVTVQVFNSWKGYYNYRNALSKRTVSYVGYYSRIFDEVVLWGHTNNLQGKLFHECFHHWLHSYLDLHSDVKEPPRWLNEGLGMYFQAMTLDKKGQPIFGRNFYLLPGLKKKIKKGEIKSLKKIISEHKKFEYDESWGIAHFLMHSQSRKRLPLIGDYIKRLMQGENHIKAFEEVFGSDYSSLEKEWKRYILAL